MAAALPVSPLAPKIVADLLPMEGVRLGAVEAGIKYAGRKDLAAIVFDQPAVVAGVFTTSRCASAPVDWCRNQLERPGSRAGAVVINSGNANAFTGSRGAQAAEMTARAASETFGIEGESVYLASTGVIGEPLDSSQFQAHLAKMDMAETHWADVASAIMTTDTYAKLATQSVVLDGESVTINGIAKGSGMIAPDMATMLAFVITDADIAPALLQTALNQVNAKTFNAITVDSDTSTSDTALLFATGRSGPRMEGVDDSGYEAFKTALHAVFHDLAQQIVRDGEGATKLVQIDIRGAVDDASAARIARSIANSPLVKTAIAGEDANWGRVVMAVGKAGEPADRDRLCISFGDVQVAKDGERDPQYSEDAAADVMGCEEILLTVEIGLGDGEATVWSCDLTKQYVAINGDYRS